MRRDQADVRNVRQTAELHELLVTERHGFIVERRRQHGGDDPVGRQSAKAVRCAAGVDRVDFLFIDLEFFHERVKEIVRRSADTRQGNGFTDQILRLVDVLVRD